LAAVAGVVGAWPTRALGVIQEGTKKAAAGGTSGGPETFNRWVEVRPGFHVAIGTTGENFALLGGNSTLIATKDASALIDTKQAVVAPALRREALTKTAAIVQVFNTHHHFDHAGGNALFSRDAALSAHPKACERIAGMRASFTAQLKQQIKALEEAEVAGAKQAAEDAKAFEKSIAELKEDAWTPKPIKTEDVKNVAGKKVEVHHVGPGHTDNDVFYFFPDDNVLIAGDLVFNNLHAYYDKDGGASSAGWMKSLERIVHLCDSKTVVVPGHGDIGDLETVKKQMKYFEDVRALVEKALKDGKPREEVEKMALPAYAAYRLDVARGLVLGGIYDELKK
jgi:glyoxylase-like metal-dependent hydrolase (beta-lactamase superfamily II)